jgi:ribosomal protein S24E
MEMKERHNPLLNRKEIELKVSDSQVPPSMEAARKIVAEKLSVAEEHVHINKVAGKFGSRSFTIIASVYGSPSEKERLHLINKKEKKAAAPAK